MSNLILPWEYSGSDEFAKSLGCKVDRVKFTQSLALVKGVEMYLYSAPGMREGVSVLKTDIDSGAVTERQVDEAVGQAWLDQVAR